MFSALSGNEDNLNSKISVFIALAPVATMGHGGPRRDKDAEYLLKNVDHF